MRKPILRLKNRQMRGNLTGDAVPRTEKCPLHHRGSAGGMSPKRS